MTLVRDFTSDVRMKQYSLYSWEAVSTSGCLVINWYLVYLWTPFYLQSLYPRIWSLIDVQERPCDGPTFHSRHTTEGLNTRQRNPGRGRPWAELACRTACYEHFRHFVAIGIEKDKINVALSCVTNQVRSLNVVKAHSLQEETTSLLQVWFLIGLSVCRDSQQYKSAQTLK